HRHLAMQRVLQVVPLPHRHRERTARVGERSRERFFDFTQRAFGQQTVAEGERAPGARLLLATHALEHRPKHAAATLFGVYPGTIDEGRIVADMLGMTAIEYCDGLARLIRSVIDDATLHGAAPTS